MANVRILLAAADKGACSYYRILLPYRHCRERLLKEGIELVFPEKVNWGERYDAAIFSRTTTPAFHPVLLRMIAAGTKLFWDLDDNLFTIPEWSPVKSTYNAYNTETLHQCLQMSSGVNVSTEPLREGLGFPEKTSVAYNLIDADDWLEPRQVNHKKKTVLWTGSNTHDRDINLIIPALLDIKKYWPDTRVVFYGYCPDAVAHEKRLSPTVVGPNPNHFYPGVMSLLAPSVGLAPLSSSVEDSRFNHCKSNIKFLEYTMSGAATVASLRGPYGDSIHHGVTGVLCDNAGDWVLALRKLLTGPDGRTEEVAAAAREYVLANWTWQRAAAKVEAWMAWFRRVANECR